MIKSKYPYAIQFYKAGNLITVPCRIIKEYDDSYVIEYQSGNTYSIDKEEFEKFNQGIKHFTSDVFPPRDSK